MALRYASGLFQVYFLFLSLFSPFIPKLLKGAIFRPTNILPKIFVAAPETFRPRRPPSSPSVEPALSKIRLESAPIHGVDLCRRSPILGACCWGGIEGCESFLANLANSSESRERPVWQ